MTPYNRRVTAFTKRMAEDMQLRNLSPRTIDAYTYHVDRFAMRFVEMAVEKKASLAAKK